MSKNNNIFKNINTIAIPTWSWLKINDTSLESVKNISTKKYNLSPNILEQDGLSVKNISEGSQYLLNLSVEIDAKNDLRDFAETKNNSGYFIHVRAGETIEKPVVFDFNFNDENDTLISNDFIFMEKNSIATIIFRYKSHDELTAINASFTKIHLEENSKLNLIKINMLDENSVNLDFIGGHCESNSEFNPIIADLGSLETIGNCDVALIGEKSRCNLETIYLGKKEEKLDYNYRISFHAKNSFGKIVTNGVLMDRAKKVYRGTIDFFSGSSGSVGSEEEHTILLSPHVKNVSVPLLLSGEHDVEGNHATSTGRLDTNALFYLMSRGISERQAKKMIVEAAFSPLLEKISDEKIKNETTEFVRRHLENAQ